MRIFLIEIRGLGVGSLPDYSKYNKQYHNTLLSLTDFDKIENLSKLGLLKCCFKDMDSRTIGYYARGRMLSTQLSFDSCESEILGNLVFDDNLKHKEDLFDRLSISNINTLFVSSAKNDKANIIYNNDSELINDFNVDNVVSNSFVMICLNDFAKYSFEGNVEQMKQTINCVDKFVGDIINKIDYDDVLIITGNCGVNCVAAELTREYVPILAYSKVTTGSKNLTTVQGLNTIALSVVDLFNIYPNDASIFDKKDKTKFQSEQLIEKKEKLTLFIDKVLEDFSDKFVDKTKLQKKVKDKLKDLK